MPKTWTCAQAKKFCRELELGKPYYLIRETGRVFQPFDDPYYAVTVTFTDRLPFTNNPCTANGYSAEQLCQVHGPVYDTPPPGIRNLDDPAPNYAPSVGGVHAGAWLAF